MITLILTDTSGCIHEIVMVPTEEMAALRVGYKRVNGPVNIATDYYDHETGTVKKKVSKA